MKKPLILFVIVGLAIGLGASTAQAISLDFSPVSQEVILGNQVVVDLMITGLGDGAAPSLGAFDLDVAFDPAILSFNDVAFGNQLSSFGLGSTQDVLPGDGLIDLFEISFETEGNLNSYQDSAFVLASFTFDTIGVGTSPLTIIQDNFFYLGDASAFPLFADELLSGSVTVSAPVPEPTTILLLAVGLGGLGFVKRRKLMNS